MIDLDEEITVGNIPLNYETNPLRRLGVYTRRVDDNDVSIDIASMIVDLVVAIRIGRSVGVGPNLDELIRQITKVWHDISVEAAIPLNKKN